MPIARKEAFSIQLLLLVDAALVGLAFMIGEVLRTPLRNVFGQGATEAAGLREMSWVLYVAVPFTPIVLEFLRFYIRIRSKNTFQAISQLIRAMLVMVLVIGLLGAFAKLPEASRLILGLGSGLTFLFLLLRDRLLHRHLQNREIREDLKERIVIAGTAGQIEEFLQETDPEILEAWRLVDRFELDQRPVKELYTLLKAESVERVIFTAGGTGFDKVAEGVEACELQGVEAWIAASFIRTQIARPTFDVIGDQPMLVLRSTPELSWELAMKAVFDRVVAVLILVTSTPIWLAAYVGIKITSPGDRALFFQNRAGRYGKPFKMWKFRTMVPDAEALLAGIKESHGNQMQGPVFKLERDPRIFPFGAFLRKFSIDELPQLINVIKGDMSLVGPRPLPLYEVDAFEKSEHRRRLSVKPGITCEWQAGGRNKINSFEQWVEMDLRYIDNWSFWLDMKILIKTVPAVLFGWGAR